MPWRVFWFLMLVGGALGIATSHWLFPSPAHASSSWHLPPEYLEGQVRPKAGGCSFNCTFGGTTTTAGITDTGGITSTTLSLSGTGIGALTMTGTNQQAINFTQNGAGISFNNGASRLYANGSGGLVISGTNATLTLGSGGIAGGTNTITAGSINGTGFTGSNSASSTALTSQNADAVNAIGWSISTQNTFVSSGTRIVTFENPTGTVKASVASDGYIASLTPSYLPMETGTAVLVNGATLDGMVLPARAFTATGITGRINAAGTGGTTGLVFKISDGTNTCTFTRVCTGTGNVRVAGVNGAGTGCAFPASASLTLTVDATSDCATYPSIVNGGAEVEGKWQ